MKKIMLTCALLASVSVISLAQTNHPEPHNAPPPGAPVPPIPPPVDGEPAPEKMAEQRAKMTQDQYKLSTEQYRGIYRAELDFFTKERQMRKSGKPLEPEQVRQMMEEKNMKYKKVMNKEQFARYDKTSPKMPAPPPHHPAPPSPANQPAAH